MIILRDKIYSGYSETNPLGTSYHAAQVVSDYAIDPVDKSVDWIDNSEIGKIEPIKKKTKLVKRITSSLKSLMSKKSEGRR